MQATADYRMFVKHVCKSLVYLDLKFYGNQEIQRSKELFKGRLTNEIIEAKTGQRNEAVIQRLSFDGMGLCHYDRELNLK